MGTEMQNSLCLKPFEWIKGKMIGSGSFGNVHIAMNKNNGHLFIVKSSQVGIGSESLENEASILMKLKNSPYVVKCLGKEITRGPNNKCLVNIFLEHMGGGNLFDIMYKIGGHLSEGAIRSYTRQILLGMNHLHENGVVHGDIKCQNMLLDSYGKVKLADFGCARMLNDSGNDTSMHILKPKEDIRGTPLWMAPEVLGGERLNYAADIWSLGCTIIEMATGRPPHWGCDMKNPMAAIYKIITSNERPCFPKEFSQDGFDFLEMCLQRNPMKRPTTNALLHHPFVSSNFDLKINLMKGPDAYSPTSVLDIGMFDIGFSDCEDEAESDGISDEGSFSDLSLTSRKPQVDKDEFKRSFLEIDTNNKSSEDWITVRSI